MVATRGPTPFSEVTGANSGNRISGRIATKSPSLVLTQAEFKTIPCARDKEHMMADETLDPLDTLRRKLRFRAWHRGTREADLIMGQFADARIGTMTEDELAQFDAVLEVQDLDVYNWIIGKSEIPPEYQTSIMQELLDFDFRLPGSHF